MSLISQNLRILLRKPIFNSLYTPKITPNGHANYHQTSYKLITDLQERKVNFEVSKNPDEWKYVERVLPSVVVPNVQEKKTYLTNWRPQSKECLKYPYFIQRTKNHMLPVFMKVTYRGMRRLTFIRYIQGDIWKLESEIKEFLQKDNSFPIETRVNEFTGIICVHGDHVNAIKYWLQQKNF